MGPAYHALFLMQSANLNISAVKLTYFTTNVLLCPPKKVFARLDLELWEMANAHFSLH